MNPILLYQATTKRFNLLPSLVAYYSFDSTLADATTLSPTGTGTGTINYVSGKNGNAVSMGTTTSYVDVADTTNFSFTNGSGQDLPFSFAVWVQFTSFSSTLNMFANKRNGTLFEWAFYRFSSDGSIRFDKYTSNGAAMHSIICSNTTSTGQWYHLVYTDDGSETVGGMKIYINGVLGSTTTTSSGSYTGMGNTTSVTRIGNHGDGVNAVHSHRGYLDGLSIWKGRTLTAAEVTYLYNSGNGRAYPF